MTSVAIVPHRSESLGGAAALRSNLHNRTIPSLTGLRGIAALTVVLFHVFSGTVMMTYSRWLPGDAAVALFFELSGLLITWLLLREKSNIGGIDFKRFYQRRALRLFPAFYTLWFICAIFPHVHARWWAFFYMRDIASGLPGLAPGIGVLSMAWSLGVEEKFYLIWPLLLRFCQSRKAPLVLVGIGVLDQGYRTLIGLHGYVGWAGWGFETHLDGLLLGAATAIAIKQGWRPPAWIFHPLTLLVSISSVELTAALIPWPQTVSWGTAVAAYPLMLIMLNTVAQPPRLLNNPVVEFFGKISYSLYLYHLLLIYLMSLFHFSRWRYQVVAVILGSILTATASHYCIERPFLRKKAKLHPHRRRFSVVSVQIAEEMVSSTSHTTTDR